MGHRGLLLPLLLAALCLSGSAAAAAAKRGSKKSYAAIFSFGDSLSDAGNLIVNGTPKALTTARAPYGMTFFGRPTGRCSNGRVVVDFLGNKSHIAAWLCLCLLLLPRRPLLLRFSCLSVHILEMDFAISDASVSVFLKPLIWGRVECLTVL
jgi:hypothetical protein